MCCCGSTHVKKGAKIIGIIHLILSIVSILNYLISPTAFGGKIAVLILSSLTIVPIITLLIGVKKENHRYLIPYLILEGFNILWCISMIIYIVVVFLLGKDESAYHHFDNWVKNYSANPKIQNIDGLNRKILLTALTLYFIGAAILFGWWFSVVCKCYKYFKELAEAREHGAICVKHYPPGSA